MPAPADAPAEAAAIVDITDPIEPPAAGTRPVDEVDSVEEAIAAGTMGAPPADRPKD
jgi:hypothetical protein